MSGRTVLRCCVGLGVLLMSVAMSESRTEASTRTPIRVRIVLPDPIPGIAQPFDVEAVVASDLDAPGAVVQLHASSGIRLSGERKWRRDLAANVEARFRATAVIETPGDHEIGVRARRTVVAGREVWGDLDVAYFHASGSGTRLGHEPPRGGGVERIVAPARDVEEFEIDPALASAVHWGLEAPVPPPPGEEGPGGHGGTPGLGGSLTITSRLVGRNPNDALIDIGELLGQVLDATTGAHIAFFFADARGVGTVTFANPGANGFFVTWWAYNDWSTVSADDNRMVVRPNGTTDWPEAFKVNTGGFVLADGAHDIGSYAISAGEPRRGAFSILNDVNDAWLYIYSNGGNFSPEGVHVEWQQDSTHGTHYHLGGEIHLGGNDWGTSASLPPSDTVVHEFGHAAMYHVYGDVFPPSDCPDSHFIEGATGYVCAWTEGWADFLPLAVHGRPAYVFPSGALVNIEAATWGTFGWDSGDRVEGRVAGTLLDLFDATNEGLDTRSDGFGNIWFTLYTQNDDQFSQFVAAWDSNGFGDCPMRGAAYQNTIDYDLPPVLGGLPDVTLNEDTTRDNAIDLWPHAFHTQCQDNELQFSITGNTDSRVGVTIDSSRYIDIRPQADFFGSSTVTIRATDSAGKFATDQFVVTVVNVNDAPGTPVSPTGTSSAVTTVSYGYTSRAAHPDGGNVQIRFDFGDGTVSGFSGFVASGTPVTMNHSYAGEGIFLVRAQARDASGATSAFSAPLAVDVSVITYRYGNVDLDNGGPAVAVLFVNGSSGDAVTRELTVDNDDPLIVTLDQALSGPSNPRYVVWGWANRPTRSTDTSMPRGVGVTCMNPFRATCGSQCPLFAANELGRCDLWLCDTPEATGATPPAAVLTFPGGRFPAGKGVTFQGLIQDSSDSSGTRFSVTNAVVVRFTD